MSAIALYVVPQFFEMYDYFGTNNLPFLTNLIIATYQYWLILVIIPIGVYSKYVHTNTDNEQILPKNILPLLILFLFFIVLLLPLMITSLYLPIFEFAKTSV